MRIAVYPGSFDPITNGHIDILKRALKVFDKVIVLVAINDEKKGRFSIQERVSLIKEATKDFKNVEVDSYNGLTVDYAKKVGAISLIRGLRAVTDFEYEFSLSSANNFANKDIDMVFFMAHENLSFISSSSIMTLNENGVDVSSLVPKCVFDYLNKNKHK